VSGGGSTNSSLDRSLLLSKCNPELPVHGSFSVTFPEAAARECPVISSLLSVYAEAFAEEYFHLVPTDDLAKFSDAIVEFVNLDGAAVRGRLT
jgi:glycosyltransferase involved in cell wall biosynthesis